ncbi:hypothetical protein LJC32_06625 [Oscillospiraceae bacterium OttesenSCG-928-F05]|nr:hypothetical protein [Oscillospiraceae bacterium OttesenSCG-928-F05]
MSKKIAVVIILESLLLITAAGVFFLSSAHGVDLFDMFRTPTVSQSPRPGMDDTPGFWGDPIPTDTPEGGESEVPVRPQITAQVELEGNLVTVREHILLTEETTRFHGYLFAGNFSQWRIRAVAAPAAYLEGYQTDLLNVYVDFGAPTREVELTYSFNLKYDDKIMSASSDMVRLTHFLMVPAVVIDGAEVEVYTSSFGDPFVYDVYDYTVSVNAEESYDVYARGCVDTKREDGRIEAEFRGELMRDFPVVLARNLPVVTERTASGILVTYIDSHDCAPFINNALEFAESHIGPYPYEEYFVVKTPISTNNGMEFSSMIFIKDSVFSTLESLKDLAYHETFHQWFYCVIGVDQLNEPFLDEGLVTYLAAYLRNGATGSGGDTRFLGRSLRDYSNKTHYNQLAYSAAAGYFGDMHKTMGDEAFFALLRRVYTEKTFRILRYEELLSYIPA